MHARHAVFSSSGSKTRRLHAVSSCGGSLARQYRVQYLAPGYDAWKIHASFRDRAEAEQALAQLRRQGQIARLIEIRLCPSAS